MFIGDSVTVWIESLERCVSWIFSAPFSGRYKTVANIGSGEKQEHLPEIEEGIARKDRQMVAHFFNLPTKQLSFGL